ncbi:MAG: phosphatidate cytidylyltransferase [Spirochaetes bacterium]|nr:phosphatidate cytidylyltransferase [Spirochaetota bacterium]
MEQILSIIIGRRSLFNYANELRTEILRKSIHFLIATVPALAAWNLGATMALLGSGIILYAYCETLRLQGYDVAIVSRLTAMAARKRDTGRFVMGPVTLGLGALVSLLLYPEPAASIAIYTLAFGDGLSSLVGRLFGTIRIPFTGGKSVEGSLACFTAVLVSAYGLSGRLGPSLGIAAFATIVEAVPSKDYDNIILPVAVGFMARLIF